MATREDIDALLIGRLYGELGSADEARLQAHLDANPEDRNALTGLTEARGLVKGYLSSGRLLETQQEPPQSLSALLMQEAARRAPKQADRESWFQRFMRSFIAHPAMAAAATLVLVVGIAGTMYMKKGSQFATETTSSSAAARDMEKLRLESPSGNADVAAAAPTAAPLQQTAAGSGSAVIAQASGEVALDESKNIEGGDRQGMAVGLADSDGTSDHGVAANAVAPGRKQGAASRGLEVTTPSAEPKDLAEDQIVDVAKADRAYATKPTTDKPAPAKVAHSASLAYDDAPGAYGAGGGQATTGALGGVSPKGTAADPSSVAQEENSKAKDSKVVSTTKPSPPPPPAVAATPAPTTPTTSSAPAAQKKESTESVNDRELQAAVSAAQQNKCDVADRYATSIANRDLDYYSSQVEDNRELKHCKAVMKQAPRAASSQRAKRATVKATASEPSK